MRTVLLSLVVGVLSGGTFSRSAAVAQVPAPVKKPVAAPAQPVAKPAQPATAAASGAEDAVRKASKDYLAALNSGDFKTAAGFWTADGQYIDPAGKSVNAARVVAEDLAKRFPAGKRPQIVLDVKSVRLASPDAVLEEGTVEMKQPGGETTPRGQYSSVWVKQQNRWLIKSIRETAPAALAHNHSLSELGWLVGNWTAEADGNTVRIDCNWTPGKIYLMRTITVERNGKVEHSVTQRIGLDPMSPKIKSWSFDADGGMSEAFWDKSGDTWHVYTRGASRSGQVTSARNIYTDIGRDSFTLESVEAHTGSQSQPEFKLKFSRSDSTEPAPAATAGPAPGPAPTGTANPAFSAAENAQRQAILNSPEWQQTQQAYHEWLSVQKIYTPAEVKQLKVDTAAKIAKMSAAQLRSFLEDAHEKVGILLSKQADDARAWLAQRMAVEVKLTPEELKKERPDIANMTAAQVEQRLLQVQQQRTQTQQSQAAFDAGRKFRIKSIDDAQKEADSEREQALDRAAESMDSGYGGYGGYYGGGGRFGGGLRGGGGYYGGFRY